MVDHLTIKERSRCMASIHSRDTTPEITVRKMAYALGYRYRLCRKDLPGKPDLLFVGMKKAIMVHGCFWHMHRCKHLPKSHVKYWKLKLEENVRRDRRNLHKLKKLGWKILIIWECQTRDIKKLSCKLVKFLKS